MWIGVHELEKVHGASNTQQERQPRHQIPIASLSYHESMCPLRKICRPFHMDAVNSRTRGTCRTDRSHMTWALEEITHPIICNLCTHQFEGLQTFCAHVRFTHLPFPSPTIRESRHAQPARQPRRHKQHSRDGHEREPRMHQEGRQPRRRGAAKAASTNRQPNQAGRSAERRSGRHAEADADPRRKGAARGKRTHTRPTLRLGLPGLGQVSPGEGQRSGSDNGTGHSDLRRPTGTALTNSKYATKCDSAGWTKRTKQTSRESR